jgi:CheY-like chemotaxis protein
MHASTMQAWNSLHRPIWLFDPVALRGVYANASALELWGADSLEDLLARDFSRLSPAVLARTERLARVTAYGEPVSEQWTFYPKGQPLTVMAVISTYRLDDGTPVLLFEAAPIEVESDERRAVEALRHTSTLITLFDAEGAPLFCNPAAFAAYGSTTHAFESRFAEPERSQPMLAAALAGKVATEVCEIVTRDGLRWHHLDVRRVTDPVTGQPGVLLNERDVTERVEAEQARVAAEQKAAMAEARQHFLTEMSHELRTPLNTVIGFSDLLAASALNHEQAANLGRINAAGQRLLAVVNEMIEMSGGDTISQPHSESDQPAPLPFLRDASTVDPVEESPAPDAPMRVLYVDDHDNNRALVVAVLRAQGVDCATAEDGAQGLAAARDGDWDLILMDIQMPVMDGVTAARAIRALPGHRGAVPIVALTANTLPEQKAEYAAVGMDDCMAKPINIAELTRLVMAWSAVDWRTEPPQNSTAVA